MYSTKVESTHLDMFGHVNNARFLEYFEWARWAWARELGVDFLRYIDEGTAPAAVRMEVNFLRELRFNEVLQIETRLFGIGTKSFDLVQELSVDGGSLSATLKVKLVFMDVRTRRAVPIPGQFMDVLNTLKES